MSFSRNRSDQLRSAMGSSFRSDVSDGSQSQRWNTGTRGSTGVGSRKQTNAVKTVRIAEAHRQLIMDKGEFWARLEEAEKEEAIRLQDPAVQEELEYEAKAAAHFDYPAKIKVGSQFGLGKRSIAAPPRWIHEEDKVVEQAMETLKDKETLFGETAMSLARLLDHNLLDVNPEPLNFVRLQPFSLSGDTDMLCGLKQHEMPRHKGVATFISAVNVGYSDLTLTQAITESKVDVVVANSVRINVPELCKCLPQVRSLGLTFNQLGTNLEPLHLWIKGNSRMERLAIINNHVTDEGTVEFSRSLAQNTSLTSLSLKEGRISDIGAAALSEVLAPCHCQSMIQVFAQEEQLDLMDVALCHGYGNVGELLHVVARCGASKTIKFLLKKYPELKDYVNDAGRTPLMEACIAGKIGSMKALIQCKASLSKRDRFGRTVVQLAALHGHDNVMHFLLNPWRDSHPDLETPLLINFEIEAVKYLRNMQEPVVDKEAGEELDPEEKPAQAVKASLRQRAAKRIISGFGSQVEKKKAAVVERPIEVFFEVSTGGGQKHVTNSFLVPVLSDVTMLHLRVPFPVQNYGLNAIVDIKVCINDDREQGVKTLGFCHVPLATLLEKHPEAASFWTQIFWKQDMPCGWLRCRAHAVWMYLEQESLLGTTALYDAAQNGFTDVVETLLLNGASIDTTDSDNNTPLVAAVFEGHQDTMNMLLKHHSELDHRNRMGVTPLIAAERKEWNHLIPLIQMHLRVARGLPIDIENWTAPTIRPMTPIDAAGFSVTPGTPKTPGTPGTPGTPHENHAAFVNANKKRHAGRKRATDLDFLLTMYKGEFADSQLDLELVCAVNLPKADILGKSDPYVKVQLNGVMFKTVVMKNTLDPVWEECVVFDDQSRGVWREQKLLVEIFDWNRVGSEKLLGRIAIDVQDFESIQAGQPQGEEWFFLNDENGNQVYGPSKSEKEKKAHVMKKEKASRNLMSDINENSGQLESDSKPDALKHALDDDRPQPAQFLIRWNYDAGSGKFVMFRITKGLHFPTDKKKRPLDLQAWVECNGLIVHSAVQKKTTSPEFGWEVRVPTRTNDTQVKIIIREENAKDSSKPGKFVAGVAVTTGQVETLVSGGLTQGWVELRDEDGSRMWDSDGSATMILMGFGIWTKKTQMEVENDKVKFGAPPEPRPPHRLSPEAWDVSQALKATLEPTGWARDAFKRHSHKIFDPFSTKDDDHAYLLDVEQFRSLMLELGETINPMQAEEMFVDHSTFSEPSMGIFWEDLCEILGFDRETPFEEEEFEKQNTDEIVVNGHCLAKIGLRVELREEAKEKFPDLMKDSNDGPGTIFYVDHSLDGDLEASKNKPKVKGLISHVQWDRTGKRADYRTGYWGGYRLKVYVPKSTVNVDELSILFPKHRICSLRTLDLSHNRISNAGATSIARALALNNTLESICLAGNRIGADGGREFGEMLKANRTILRLEFESNRIRDEGIFTMYEALQETDSVLQFLGLNDNEMTGKCCKLLAKMFISNKSLNTLHLAKNGLGGDGALLLGEGIRISHSIVNLDVSRNALGSKGIEKIFLGLKARPGKVGKPPVPGNDSLERLVARANNIHDDVVENIDELIMGHRRIQEVDLRDNDLSEASIKKIADVIAEKKLAFKEEYYAIKLQKVWRGVRQRMHKEESQKRAWTTLRKHVFKIEDQSKSVTFEESPELWAKNAFLAHQIAGKGLTAAGLQTIILQLGRETSFQACAKLIRHYSGKDSTFMLWPQFCSMMDISPTILESYEEPEYDEDQDNQYNRGVNDMSTDDFMSTYRSSQSKQMDSEGESHALDPEPERPVLFLGWEGDKYDEEERNDLLDEASNMLQSIRQNLRDFERDSDSDGEYDIDDEHRKIEELEIMEEKANQLLQDAEAATMSLIKASNPDVAQRPGGAITDSVVQGVANSLERYEELEKLLEAPDTDHETITRMVRELEDVQTHALQDLGKAEIAAQVDRMRRGAGLDLSWDDEDDSSPSFHPAVERAYAELQAALEDENDDINAISMAVENFEKAREEALVMASTSEEKLVRDEANRRRKAWRKRHGRGSVSFRMDGDESSDHQTESSAGHTVPRRQHTGGTLEV